MKRHPGRGTTLKEYLAEEMRDPEYRRLYKRAGVELQVALAIYQAREVEKMSQGDLARALKTKQQTISRIECGAQNVTIGTLNKIAHALKRRLEIRFVDADSARR